MLAYKSFAVDPRYSCCSGPCVYHMALSSIPTSPKLQCWMSPTPSTWSCVAPRLGTPQLERRAHIRAGCVRMTRSCLRDKQSRTLGSMTSHPHLLSSPCLLPGTIFGYFSALVPAKPQSPEPSFLHSQLLKAGSKAGTASFQVGFHGQGLWLEHSLQSKRSRQKGTSWDSPCRMFLCPFCCQHACQGGTLPASLLPAPCCCQPSQSYCHRAPTPCCIFTHSCM